MHTLPFKHFGSVIFSMLFLKKGAFNSAKVVIKKNNCSYFELFINQIIESIKKVSWFLQKHYSAQLFFRLKIIRNVY